MNQQFKEKSTTKIYWAIVETRSGNVSGHLVHWLVKDEKRNKTEAFKEEHKNAKRSELHFRAINGSGRYQLLEVRPITGRSHQIRVQLASEGLAIVGDIKYGYSSPNADGSICLHAYSLTFKHPITKEELTIKADPPNLGVWKHFG